MGIATGSPTGTSVIADRVTHWWQARPETASPAYATLFRAAVAEGVLDLPLPGSGATRDRFAALAALGRADPVLARLAEGHADAVAILAELHGPDPGVVPWGVWAAVPASVTAEHGHSGWQLTGDRPWCSGAGYCDRALITAGTPAGIQLFAVDLAEPGVTRLPGTWPAVGMAGSDSRTVRFAAAPGVPVGRPGDYVDRSGFWAGAAGVAACWYGGAAGVAACLLSHDTTDPHRLAHLGAVDAALAGAHALLNEVADAIDRAEPDLRRLARQARAVTETAATEVIDRVGRALGAGPLCQDATHAHRVADLTVYLRQSHAEQDLAALGADVAAAREPGW